MSEKLNLLEGKLFFGLTIFLFLVSLFAPTSPGLAISFFTTVSVVLTISNLGVPVTPVPVIAIICHLLWIIVFLFISVNNNNTPSLLYIQRVGGIFGAVLFITGLVQVKKINNGTKINDSTWALFMAVIMGTIGFLLSL